jgi:hypothetical protein
MRKKAVRPARHQSSVTAPNLAKTAENLATGLLVLVELGAEWPGLLGAEAGSRRVVTQLDGETPAAFAARVGGLLDGLFGRGIALGTAIIACNERLDAPAEAARRKLAGLALGAMAKHKAGRVYLAASERSSARLRQALTGLSQGLFQEWRTAGLEVSVSCGEARSTPLPQPTFVFTARVA